MKKDLLHTPEGVRDIYSTECVEKKIIENRLHDDNNNFVKWYKIRQATNVIYTAHLLTTLFTIRSYKDPIYDWHFDS